MTVLLIYFFIYLLAASAAFDSETDSCTTVASGSDSCTTSPGPQSDLSSLLQGRLSYAQGAKDKISAALVQDANHNIEKMRAVGMSAAQPQAEKAASRRLAIVFGVMTSPLPKYAEQLAAVEATWAKDVAPQKLLVIGVNGSSPGVIYKPAPMCQDGHTENSGNSCKAATVVAAAYELGADWVVVGDTDTYMFPRRWEHALEEQDFTVPQILGVHGCGSGMFCDDSKPGLCGGGSYAVSRGAMEKMVGKREGEAQSYIQECIHTSITVSGNWSDQVASCVARRYGVKEVQFEGLYPCQLRPDEKCAADDADSHFLYLDLYWAKILSQQVLSFHYIPPGGMRELHKMVKDIDAGLDSTAPAYSLMQVSTASHHSDRVALVRIIEEHKKYLAGEASAQQYKRESSRHLESTSQARMPQVHELDVSRALGAHELHAFHALQALWYSGMIMKDPWLSGNGYLKVLSVVAVVTILLIMFLPMLGMTVLLNMLLFVVYILWSSALLFVNRNLIHDTYVQPVVLVTLQMFASACVTRSLYCIIPQHFVGLAEMQKMTSDERYEFYRGVALIVGCFATSLVLENSAYAYASVAFLQMIKETGLIVVAAFALAMGLDTFTPRRLGLLALVVAGACMCVRGEVHLTLRGPAMQILSNFCNGARLTMQNKMLLRGEGIKLEPLSYVAFVSPICFCVLVLPALAMPVIHHDMLAAIKSSIGMISLSCTLAVGNNLLVAILVQRASAIGFALLGAFKNALIIIFSCFALGVETSICQMLGCSLVFFSSTTYAVLTQWGKQEPAKETVMHKDPYIDPKTKNNEDRPAKKTNMNEEFKYEA